MIYIASGYLTRPAKLRQKGRFINEIRLSTGFMNEVTSRFVLPLCSRPSKQCVWGEQKKLEHFLKKLMGT